MKANLKKKRVKDLIDERISVIREPIERSLTLFLDNILLINTINYNGKQQSFIISNIRINSDHFLTNGIFVDFDLINVETLKIISTNVNRFTTANSLLYGIHKMNKCCSFDTFKRDLMSYLQFHFSYRTIEFVMKERKKNAINTTRKTNI